jgi:hypothetical protein
MSPDRAQRPFADAAPAVPGAAERLGAVPAAAGAARRGIDPSVAIAAAAAWLLLVAVYSVLFTLSGFKVAMAIRGAFANGIPDGLLGLAVLAACRRLDARRVEGRWLLLAHLPRAAGLVGLAFVGKSLLVLLDTVLVRMEPFRLMAGVVAWQVFLSTLTYAAIAATAHAWLIDRRLREEEARAARQAALRARAELAALRAQLNPHFVFNVLHSILGMIRRDAALAETALEGLGDLLRYALRVHRDTVDRTALRHEWEFMETYLRLERIRLGDRLRVVSRVDESALDHPVPTFSLQPLVENAVRHGIASRAEGGRIVIDAGFSAGGLRIEVTNDGAGREVEANGDEGGTGLRVLRDRLEALYGGRAEMTLGPSGEGEFRVVMTLPAEADSSGPAEEEA